MRLLLGAEVLTCVCCVVQRCLRACAASCRCVPVLTCVCHVPQMRCADVSDARMEGAEAARASSRVVHSPPGGHGPRRQRDA